MWLICSDSAFDKGKCFTLHVPLATVAARLGHKQAEVLEGGVSVNVIMKYIASGLVFPHSFPQFFKALAC